MDIGVISVRYARALLRCATEDHEESVVYREMQQLSNSYTEVPLLRQAISNPMIAKEDKQKLLTTAIGEEEVSRQSQSFLALILKEGRENLLQFMANSYVTLYREQMKIIRGKLTTAVGVSPQTEQRMRQMVAEQKQGTVEFETEVNPDIIGGFILEYDTYRMDASVKSKLNTILNSLKK